MNEQKITLTAQEAYALGIAVQAFIHGDYDHAIHMIIPGHINGRIENEVFMSLFDEYFITINWAEASSRDIMSTIQAWLNAYDIQLVVNAENARPEWLKALGVTVTGDV